MKVTRPITDQEAEGFRLRLQMMVDKYRSVNAFAKGAGIAQSNLRAYLLEGREPTRRNLIAMADFAGVRLEWLLRGQLPIKAESEVVQIPIYRLNDPNFHPKTLTFTPSNQGFPVDQSLLASLGCRQDAAFSLIQQGEAMAFTIRPGDLVLVNRELNSLSVEGIYAVAFGSLISLRRMVPGASGPRLVTDNPAYRSEDIAAHQVDDLTVMGRVVWRAGQI